jgi:very-short-patch-repair endonuclease
MSPAEVLLWLQLRKRPGGLKFRHQHPAGPLSLDFYCAAARLCVEVDGECHDRGANPITDAKRDALLARHGVLTVRIPAGEVFRNMEGVLLGIVEAARPRLPLHRPATPGGPPPQAKLGED